MIFDLALLDCTRPGWPTKRAITASKMRLPSMLACVFVFMIQQAKPTLLRDQ